MRSSFARFCAWARESLLARAAGVLLGLCVLAAIGGSALAGGNGMRPSPAGAGAAPSSSPATGAPGLTVDGGAIPTTRPELLPRVLSEGAGAGGRSAGAAAAESGEKGSEEEKTEKGANGANGASANITRATPDDPVDLNTAREADLRRLPGVGAKRAEAILALRARLPGGRFRQLEDLLKVKGIGRAMLKRIHPLVRLSVEGV